MSALKKVDEFMESYQSYIYHLNRLRQDNTIIVDDFCEGICTSRQYRRYLAGTSVFSWDKLILFLRKLNLSPDEFMHSYYKFENIEYLRIKSLYNSLFTNEVEKIHEFYNLIKNQKFGSAETENFFALCDIMYKRKFGELSVYDAVDQFSKLINYPECMEKSTFSFIEIASLNRIVYHDSKHKKTESVNHLARILKDDKVIFVSNTTKEVLPNMYLNTALAYGNLGMINECLMVTIEGIKYSLSIDNHKALINLYYFESLCLYKTGKREQAYQSAVKCISLCSALGDTEGIKRYNNFFMKEQGFTISISKKVNPN